MDILEHMRLRDYVRKELRDVEFLVDKGIMSIMWQGQQVVSPIGDMAVIDKMISQLKKRVVEGYRISHEDAILYKDVPSFSGIEEDLNVLFGKYSYAQVLEEIGKRLNK